MTNKVLSDQYYNYHLELNTLYVPDVSALEQDVIEVDAETKEMLKMMDFQSIPGIQMTTNTRGGGNLNFNNRPGYQGNRN